MKKLKPPVIKKSLPRSKRLSMEDYVKFVEMNLKNSVNLDDCRKLKEKLVV